MEKAIAFILFSFLYFPSIGFAQGSNQEDQSTDLQIEILEKKISTEQATIIDYSIEMKDGQIGRVIENKETRIPKNDSVYIIAKVRLTNIQKRTIKLYPVQELIATSPQGGKCHIYLNCNALEPLTFQNYTYTNGFFGLINYRLKQNEPVVIDIIVELPGNSDQLFIEYEK